MAAQVLVLALLAKPGSLLTFSGGEVKADLYREANEFCVRQKKHLMPVTASSRDSGYGTFALAELQFRCLSEGDPELQRPTMERAPDVKVDVRSK